MVGVQVVSSQTKETPIKKVIVTRGICIKQCPAGFVAFQAVQHGGLQMKGQVEDV